MRIRVLGCSGAIAKDCRTTAFLIDQTLLVDAGTGVGDLTLNEMANIDHVVLSHSHIDHIAALPLMIDAVGKQRQLAAKPPLQVHALAGTLDALKAHIFNDLIWPDFSRLPSVNAPFMQFNPIVTGQMLVLGELQVEALPANHTVPAVGYAISAHADRLPESSARAIGNSPAWVYSGDTGVCPEFWHRINTLNVALMVIETAFSNQESNLALESLHHSPSSLATELAHIPLENTYPIYITHTKPLEAERIMSQVAQLSKKLSVYPLKINQIFDIPNT